MRLVEIHDPQGLRGYLSARLGAMPGEDEGVLHVAAVWRPLGEERNVMLRIRDDTPESATDGLLLGVARARAEAIVTTGRILREEPRVTHDLQGPAGVVRALRAWRRDGLGLDAPPWLLVLTGGRDFDPCHPALHAWARPIVLCPAARARELERLAAGAPIDVVGHERPGLRAAIDHLRSERGARRISIEVGPSTAIGAYGEPVAVDELLLSVFAERDLPAALAGGELPSPARLERLFGPPRGAFTIGEPGGRWSFERYRRPACAVRAPAGAPSGRGSSAGGG